MKLQKLRIRPLISKDLDQILEIERNIAPKEAWSKTNFLDFVQQKVPKTRSVVSEGVVSYEGTTYPWIFGTLCIEVDSHEYNVRLFSIATFALKQVQKSFVEWIQDKANVTGKSICIHLRDTNTDYKHIAYLKKNGFDCQLVPRKDKSDEWKCTKIQHTTSK